MCQNTAEFVQPQHLTGASDGALFIGCPAEDNLNFFHLVLHKLLHNISRDSVETLHLSHHNEASISPSQRHGEKPNERCKPSSSVHAWWRWPLIISVSLSGTQVCGGALLPLWSVTKARRGPGWSGLGTCRGRALPPLRPRPSEDSLFTPPDGGWIWVLMNAILHDPLEAAELQSPSARLAAVCYPTLTHNNDTLGRILKKSQVRGGNTSHFIPNFTSKYDISRLHIQIKNSLFKNLAATLANRYQGAVWTSCCLKWHNNASL